MLAISQASLVKRKLLLRDGLLERATLFPLFDNLGETEWLLLINHSKGAVYRLPFRRDLYRKPWFRNGRLAASVAELYELDLESAYDLSDLWHFDPWWLLREEPFRDMAITPPLKRTNCVTEMERTTALYFRPDLSQVSSHLFLDEQNQARFGSLKEVGLPSRESLEMPRRKRAGWRLSPFWDRKAG